MMWKNFIILNTSNLIDRMVGVTFFPFEEELGRNYLLEISEILLDIEEGSRNCEKFKEFLNETIVESFLNMIVIYELFCIWSGYLPDYDYSGFDDSLCPPLGNGAIMVIGGSFFLEHFSELLELFRNSLPIFKDVVDRNVNWYDWIYSGDHDNVKLYIKDLYDRIDQVYSHYDDDVNDFKAHITYEYCLNEFDSDEGVGIYYIAIGLWHERRFHFSEIDEKYLKIIKRMYEKSVSVSPNEELILGIVGEFLIFTGANVEKGISLLEKSIQLEPYDARKWYYCGLGWFKIEDYSCARNKFTLALKLFQLPSLNSGKGGGWNTESKRSWIEYSYWFITRTYCMEHKYDNMIETLKQIYEYKGGFTFEISKRYFEPYWPSSKFQRFLKRYSFGCDSNLLE